ncbi:MAG: CARDB domain-containing protein [Clostridium sp.]|nr:CARDB domain-containing protein [Clostridium sp.]MDU1586961.1 CARDB domain-containing protein [Clostridium sp.]
MKRLFKYLLVSFLLGVAFICATPQSAYAGTYDNAKTYYDTYGTRKIVANKKIYWATRSGSATTKNRYTIEAWRVSGELGKKTSLTQRTQGYSVPSGTAGSRSNSVDSNNSFVYHPSSVTSAGYRYDLYYIDLDKMRQESSAMDALFNSAHSSKSSVTLRLDSLTFYSVSSGQWWSGEADRKGNVASLASISQGYKDNRYGSTLGEAKGMNAGMFSGISFDGWYNQIIYVPYEEIPEKIEPTRPTVDFVSIKDDEEWTKKLGDTTWIRPTSADKAPDWTRIYSRGFQDWPYNGYPRGNNRVSSHFLRFLEADGHSEKIQMTTGNANYRYDYKDQVILNNISPQFRRWTSGTYEHSEAYTWVKFALDNKDYNVDLYVDSENGKSDGYYTKNKIKTDGKAPTVDKVPTIVDGSPDTATITFHNAGDIRGEGSNIRSGVGMSTEEDKDQSLKIYKPGEEDKAVYLYVTQRTETSVDSNGVQRYDLKWIINYDDTKLSSLGLNGYYGELKFKIHLEDWLSNTYESGEYTLRRADPTPKVTEVQLLDWDYAEPSTNIKWVKTEKDVRIKTKVKNNDMFDSLLNIPPTGTKLYLTGDNGFWDDVRVSGIVEKSNTAEGIYNSKDYKGTVTKENGINTLSAEHTIKGRDINNGKKYTLSTSGYVVCNGIKYETEINNNEVNNNILAFDGKSPILVGGIPSSDWTKSNVPINITFKDNESGMKSIELYEGTTKIASGVSSLSYTVTTEGIHNYKVVAKDNVGNIKEQTFTVKLDKTPPAISGQSLYGWSKENIRINSSATDSLSGMKSIELYDRNNSKIASSIKELAYLVTSPGVSQYKVIAKDNVGNTSDKIITVRIDVTAPSSIPKFTYDEEDFNLNINADFVIENESGIKELWAEYSPSSNASQVKKQVLTLNKSYNSTNSNLADLNGDGIVDSRDQSIITKLKDIAFGNSSYISAYDFDYDGIITSKDIQKVKDAEGNKYTYTGNSNLYDLLGECGKAKVVVKAKDNCNNERVLAEREFNVSITPVDSYVDIRMAKYQNGNTYWVNTREEFKVFTRVNTLNYPRYPRDTRLYIGGNGINSEMYSGTKIVASTSDVSFSEGSEKTKLFDKYSDYKAMESTSSDRTKKYLEATHSLIAKDAANNMKFNLYSNGSIDFRDDVFYSGMATTNKVLAVDSVAPTLISDNISNKSEDTFTIDLKGVTDSTGSGVKSVDVKVWIEENSIKKYEKTFNVKPNSNGEYKLVINRADFGNIRRNYRYQVTLTDNVDNYRVYPIKNAQMLQYNLTANRIDIFDPRENRYVTQVISGLDYYAVVEVQNTGELDVKVPFEVALERDNEFTGKVNANGLRINEVKDYRIPFVAGEENLKGVVYKGIVDYTDAIDESNELDNNVSSEKPYDIPRDESNPPVIPTTPPGGGKIPEPPPIITVELDLKASFVDAVEVGSDKVVSELIPGDKVRIKYIVENMGSLSLEHYDILNKSFLNEIYYDGTKIGEVTISDIGKDERKTFYKDFVIPELKPDEIEVIKKLTLKVDSTNAIYETNENNNILNTNKKVLGLKVTDYRIMDMVNPPKKYTYPIYIKNMPVSVKAGYNVTLRADVQGKPDRVYVKMTDNKGNNHGTYEMKKVKDISNNKAEYEFIFTTPLDSEKGTIFISEVIATRNSSTYNYNKRENWNGDTLKIGGSALEDIIIFRKH